MNSTRNYASQRSAELCSSLTGEDGTWTSIYSIRHTSTNENRVDNYNIEVVKQEAGRYYRLVITDTWQNPYAAVGELTLFGNVLREVVSTSSGNVTLAINSNGSEVINISIINGRSNDYNEGDIVIISRGYREDEILSRFNNYIK